MLEGGSFSSQSRDERPIDPMDFTEEFGTEFEEVGRLMAGLSVEKNLENRNVELGNSFWLGILV